MNAAAKKSAPKAKLRLLKKDKVVRIDGTDEHIVAYTKARAVFAEDDAVGESTEIILAAIREARARLDDLYLTLRETSTLDDLANEDEEYGKVNLALHRAVREVHDLVSHVGFKGEGGEA